MTRRNELSDVISAVDRPRARERFRTDLRRSLVATAATEWASARKPAAVRRGFFALPGLSLPRYAMAFAVVVFAIFGAGGVAAASSLPGDLTYSLKVAYEQVELALAPDDATKVEVLARQADRRLDELSRVAVSHPELAPTASAAYKDTVIRFERALEALSGASAAEREDAALDVAVSAAEKHIAVLESLRARHETEGLDNALEQAKDLKEKAKHKKDDAGRSDDRSSPSRPRATPSPRQAPKIIGTPRPDAEQD